TPTASWLVNGAHVAAARPAPATRPPGHRARFSRSVACGLRSATYPRHDTCGPIYDPCLPSSPLSAATLLHAIASRVPSPALRFPVAASSSATPFARKSLLLYAGQPPDVFILSLGKNNCRRVGKDNCRSTGGGFPSQAKRKHPLPNLGKEAVSRHNSLVLGPS